ncbi:PREDICTED: uncharacterized protein LOC105315081, partial [Amphimedon queenslandica]|uniref:HECT domain-containing protein n=1 Tax=Amphimedon queenslandica TaxID=400682 RepID=A0AAN0JTW6_AMPQE
MIEFWIIKEDYDVNVFDKRNRTPLFNAVKSGSIAAVIILLTYGAKTDVVDEDGVTLLHCAGKSGKVEMLEFWISSGDYDVNVQDKWKRTPLFNAVKSGSIEALLILLINEAGTDVVDKDGKTLLHCASESGKVEMLEFWISSGDYDVNVKDKKNRTPLFNAVKSGSIEAVDILLTNGARADVVDEDGKTLLHCAGESGKVEMFEYWIERGDYDVNVKDKRKRTPLFDAIKSGSIEAVDILLTNGARTDVEDTHKDHVFLSSCSQINEGTPLHCASETGNNKIIELLITKGKADVNAVDKNNKTPLFNAVKSGSIKTVDILLTNGARTDVVDEDGGTLLHCAGESGKVEMLEFLIKRGDYDVNVLDEDNRTPLFNAVKSGSVQAVDKLLNRGARTDVVDTKNGSTPLHIAADNAKIIELLITKGNADVNAVDEDDKTPLFHAVQSDSIEAVDILITNGARTDIVDENGETLLHCASESSKVEMLEFWIKREDFDVNVKDKKNRTPLFNAVENDMISIEAVDILLTNGARADVVDKDGETLLHCASESGKVEMLEFWIKRGDYDVNVKNKKKRTPLFHAIDSGSIEAVDILLTNGAKTDVVDKNGETLLHCAGQSRNVEMLKFWISKQNETSLLNAVDSGNGEAVDDHSLRPASARNHLPQMDNLETLFMNFEGNLTREQVTIVYESSGLSFVDSMVCLSEGPTLESILSMLNQKMISAEMVRVTIRSDHIWHDILGLYKSGNLDFGKQLCIELNDAPAIDAGGVRRQIYTTVYNEFQCNKHVMLFTGPSHSLSPACTPEARSSGLFKIL